MHCLPRILIHAHLGKHIPYYILNAGYPQFSYMRICWLLQAVHVLIVWTRICKLGFNDIFGISENTEYA